HRVGGDLRRRTRDGVARPGGRGRDRGAAARWSRRRRPEPGPPDRPGALGRRADVRRPPDGSRRPTAPQPPPATGGSRRGQRGRRRARSRPRFAARRGGAVGADRARRRRRGGGRAMTFTGPRAFVLGGLLALVAAGCGDASPSSVSSPTASLAEPTE